MHIPLHRFLYVRILAKSALLLLLPFAVATSVVITPPNGVWQLVYHTGIGEYPESVLIASYLMISMLPATGLVIVIQDVIWLLCKLSSLGYLILDAILGLTLSAALLYYIVQISIERTTMLDVGSGSKSYFFCAAAYCLTSLCVLASWAIFAADLLDIFSLPSLKIDLYDHPGAEASRSIGARRAKHRIFGWRSKLERQTGVAGIRKIMDKDTIFRRHSFEPAWWALLRGVVGLYCLSIMPILCTYWGLYLPSQLTVKDIPAVDSVYDFAAYNELDTIPPQTAYVIAIEQHPMFQPPNATRDPFNFSASLAATYTGNKVAQNCTSIYDPTFLQYFLDETLIMPFFAGTFCTVDSTNMDGTPSAMIVSMSWMSSAFVVVRIVSKISKNIIYTEPFIARPGSSFTGFALAKEMVFDSESMYYWLVQPELSQVLPASGASSNGTSITLALTGMKQPVTRQLLKMSYIETATQTVSNVGGIWAIMEGVFALIFGRTLFAVQLGTRPVSPFGLVGLFTRKRVRRIIHAQYPYLSQECEGGGMASFVRDTSIDVGFVSATSENANEENTSDRVHESTAIFVDTDTMPMDSGSVHPSGERSEEYLAVPFSDTHH